MDYNRQTREVNFTKRLGDDGTSKRLYAEDKAITKRDKSFILDQQKAGKEYEQNLAFWDKISDRPYQERVDFWDQVMPAAKQFLQKDLWTGLEMKQDWDFDKALKDLRNESPEVKAQRRDLVSDLFASETQIDFSRTSIADWAHANGHEDYAARIASMPRGGQTAFISKLIEQEIGNLPNNLINALESGDQIYTIIIDGKEVKFSGQDIYKKENPSIYLNALIEQETKLFYDFASGGKKYNRLKIAELVDDRIQPIVDQFRLGSIQGIRKSKASQNITNLQADIATKLNTNITYVNGEYSLRKTSDGAINSDILTFLSGLPQEMRSQVGLEGESNDPSGTSNTNIAIGLNRWVASQKNPTEARDFINELLGNYPDSENTITFLDKTTNEQTTYAKKWPGIFGINGNWQTISINNQTIQTTSGTSAPGLDIVNSQNGQSSGIQVDNNSNALSLLSINTSGSGGSANWTIFQDTSLHTEDDKKVTLRVDGNDTQVEQESVYVIDSNNQVTVNPAFAGTFKGEMAGFIIKGEAVPDSLLQKALARFDSTPGLANNIELRSQIIEFANSTKTSFQTTTLLQTALKNPDSNLIVNKKIRRKDIDKLGLNNNTASEFFTKNGIEVVDYIVGDGNDGDEGITLNNTITSTIQSVLGENYSNLHSANEEVLLNSIRKKITETFYKDNRVGQPGFSNKDILEEITGTVLQEFTLANENRTPGHQWLVSKNGDISKQILPKGRFWGGQARKLKILEKENLLRKINSLRETDVNIVDSKVLDNSLLSINKHIEKHNSMPEYALEAFTGFGLNPYTGYKQYVDNYNLRNPDNPIQLSPKFQQLLTLNQNVDGKTLNTILRITKNQPNQYVSNVSLARKIDQMLYKSAREQDKVGLFGPGPFRIPRTNDMLAALGRNPDNFQNQLHPGEKQLGKYALLESDIKSAFAQIGEDYDPQVFLRNENKIQERIARIVLNNSLREVYDPLNTPEGRAGIPYLLRLVHRRVLTGGNQPLDEAVYSNQGNVFIHRVSVNYSGGQIPSDVGLTQPIPDIGGGR